MNRIISTTLTLFLILSACKKEVDNISVPIVKTLPAETGRFSARLSGDVTFDEATGVLSRGIYYSTRENPTLKDSVTVHRPVTGTVTDTVVGLYPDKQYYFRAYATYTSGIAYGEQLSFTTQPAEPIWGDGATDIDGNYYKSVIIGNQEWMAENLKVTHYRNGDPIETTTPATINISEEAEPKYQWAYDGNPENAEVYGRLYTGFAATDNRGICPEGWHVPSIKEWKDLTKHVGGKNIAGHWLKEIGFSALLAGERSIEGSYTEIDKMGIFWSSTEPGDNCCLSCRWLDYRGNGIYNYNEFVQKETGKTVRCIKD